MIFYKVISILALLVFSGCTIDPVKWERCKGACRNNGGIEYVSYDGTVGKLICNCNNHAKFVFYRGDGFLK